jgi:hypothetical protein
LGAGATLAGATIFSSLAARAQSAAETTAI